jgi:hypothetical protein
VIDTKTVHQVLQTSVGMDTTVAVVSLCRDYRFYELYHVFLRYKSHADGRAGNGILLAVSTAHSTANHNIKATSPLSSVIETSVVGTDVE